MRTEAEEAYEVATTRARRAGAREHKKQVREAAKAAA
jgi:hypothetical protein